MAHRVDSSIERVTVFPGAAWVTRVARVAVTGRTEIAVVGLPAALDDDTVQISVRGPARAADVRTTIEITGAGDVAVLDDRELHERRRAVAGAQAELTHLRRQLDGLGTFGVRARVERDEAAPVWADALGARLTMVELRAAREPVLRAAVATAERAAEDARQALVAAELRRAQLSTLQLPPGAVRKALAITVEPEGAGGEVEVRASYLVPGASWAPSYVARLGDGGDLRLELRASIAQATGEDWAGVAVEVSTASPQRWVELPELPSLRIGRAQATPKRAGWRPPPPEVDALFADWDRAFASRRGRTAGEGAPPEPAPDLSVDEADAFASEKTLAPPPSFAPQSASAPMAAGARKGGYGAMLGGMPGLGGGPPPGAPPPPRRVMAARSETIKLGLGRQARADVNVQVSAATSDAVGEISVELELLAYARLHMRGPHEASRGKLGRVARVAAWRHDPRVAAAVRTATALAQAAASPVPPSGFAVAAPGAYDYAFVADARVDVPSDGGWHNVALLARPGKVAVRHVVVPAVAPEVYRVASFANPLDAPLLAGPVDVYDHGELALTASLDETAPGATVELGLGVDAAVKAARNARFHEEAAGVLRGALKLVHEVTITVENLGTRPVQLEIRERLPRPAPREEDVEVHVDRVTPTWEPWRPEGPHALEGGHRWRLELPAAGKRDLHLDYHVRIAGKHELVGGNRREP